MERDILLTVGHTPLVKLRKLTEGVDATIAVKLESRNPCGSVKDRPALSMIEAAERDGRLKPGGVVIEPTSGNTGIGLAFICAVKGYKLIITMPETMTVERRHLLAIMGADVILTPGKEGMAGAINKGAALLDEIPGSFMPNQFDNPANPEIHRKTTAEEIWDDTDGKVDVFISGVGTGGTITGVGEVIKSRNKKFKVIAVEPKDSAVLSGGRPGSHMIQGIGAGFIPKILNTKIYDEIVQVTNEDAMETALKLCNVEGILAGISSGANVWAAMQVAKRPENKGKLIVTVVCDTGERYLTTFALRRPG